MKITPEQEFWAHCSNLQTWYEYDYNTRLLHSNLAFPLLKELVRLGDSKASNVFTEQIAIRLEENYSPINQLLIEEGYLDYLSKEELESCCPDELKVDRLILASRGYTEIPPLIESLPIRSLKFLNLINNKLSIFPSFILKNKNLEILLLNENLIRLLPESINQLKMLKKLDVSKNRLEFLPSSIGELNFLEKLILSDNNLVILPDSIGELFSLKKLVLDRNKLQKLPLTIGKLLSLEDFSLSSNNLASLPSELSDLSYLKSIDFSGNNFNDTSTINLINRLTLNAAVNYGRFIIQRTKNFMDKNNSLTIEQKNNIEKKIRKLEDAINSENLLAIGDRAYDLSFY
ncbi:MAG: leucine-rich repeat domain-containing protein [Promethearchaeota archaeon]